MYKFSKFVKRYPTENSLVGINNPNPVFVAEGFEYKMLRPLTMGDLVEAFPGMERRTLKASTFS